jgi:hypothetical protein
MEDLPMNPRASALSERVLALPVRWRRSRPHGPGNPKAAAIDQIEHVLDRWESFDPPSFWRVMASLWGRAGFKGMAKVCGERLAKSAG